MKNSSQERVISFAFDHCEMRPLERPVSSMTFDGPPNKSISSLVSIGNEYRTLNTLQSSTLNAESFRLLNMTELAQRLQEILDTGFTQADLTKAADVTKGTTSQWMNGNIQSMKFKYALGIEVLTGFRAEWIVTGKLPKKKADEITALRKGSPVYGVTDGEDLPDSVQIRKVKLRLSAGIDGFIADPEQEDDNPIYFRKEWLSSHGYKASNLIAIKVHGDSMEPALHQNDTVVINTADKAPKDGFVFAVNYEGEDVIKRMVRDAGSWWLASDNQDQRRYPRKECIGEMCMLIGRVIHKQSEWI